MPCHGREVVRNGLLQCERKQTLSRLLSGIGRRAAGPCTIHIGLAAATSLAQHCMVTLLHAECFNIGRQLSSMEHIY